MWMCGSCLCVCMYLSLDYGNLKTWCVLYPGICCHCCLSTSNRFVMCFGACNCRIDGISTEGMKIILFAVFLMIFLMMLNFMQWFLRITQHLLNEFLNFFVCFGKQANRALRQATLGTLNSLIVAYGDKIGPSAYEIIIVELSSLIRFSLVASPF